MANPIQIDIQNLIREYTDKANAAGERAAAHEAEAARLDAQRKKNPWASSEDLDFHLGEAAAERSRQAEFEQRAQALRDDLMRMQGKTPPERSAEANLSNAEKDERPSLTSIMNTDTRDADDRSFAESTKAANAPHEANASQRRDANWKAIQQAEVAAAMRHVSRVDRYKELKEETEAATPARGPKL